MKTVIKVDYAGNKIEVNNSWRQTDLVINGIVVDTYKAVVGFPFKLHGAINTNSGQKEVTLVLKLKPVGGTLFLHVEEELIGKKFIF